MNKNVTTPCVFPCERKSMNTPNQESSNFFRYNYYEDDVACLLYCTLRNVIINYNYYTCA